MAAYLPVVVVLSAGGTWWQAVAGVLLAVGAVLVAFAASYRFGDHLQRVIPHRDPEQLMFRVLGLTLIVAALAELVYVSAAVGAFLVGLALSGDLADQARKVLTPLRDLFAATFFLAIGFAVGPAALLPVLPAAAVLSAVSIATKLTAGWYAASREGVGPRGRVRAGTALIAHGEFSIVIVGLVGAHNDTLAPLVVAYVFILAVAGPLITRLADVRPESAPA
jgi:CPA2 family monovalent cation:H+ antiporter-2